MTQQRQLVTTIQKDQQCTINPVTFVGSPLLTSDTTPNKDNWLLTGHWGTKHTHLLHLVTWSLVSVSFFTLFTWKCCKRLCSRSVPVIRKLDVSRLISPLKEHTSCVITDDHGYMVVSFPRTDSFTSHIVPYNHEHVGLNAPLWRVECCAQNRFLFLWIHKSLLTGHMTVSRQAWPWNRFLFWEGVDPASSQQAPNKH